MARQHRPSPRNSRQSAMRADSLQLKGALQLVDRSPLALFATHKDASTVRTSFGVPPWFFIRK